jgi:hypothetical protein
MSGKIESLLVEIRERGSMSHKEMVEFLLTGTDHFYNEKTRKHYDSILYGNKDRYGVLNRYCKRVGHGRWAIRSYTVIAPPYVTDHFTGKKRR